MLQVLKVKNFTLIDDVELRFGGGMNIITGETGAGKSILVGALGLALGNRADTSSLRDKDKKCVIEVTFDISKYQLEELFASLDLDFDSQTIFRREINANGKSRSFINDTPTTLSVLQQVGAHLVEIHSQHDNLQLFKSDFQYYCLDTLAGTQKIAGEYRLLWSTYKASKNELLLLKEKEAELAKEQDFNQFQFDELAAAQLHLVDEKELTDEQELLENAEDLIRGMNEASTLLDRSEYAILEQVNELKALLSRQRTSLTDGLADRVNSVLVELQDISGELSQQAESIEVNPARLEEVAEQVASIFNLKKKHRVNDVEELLEMQEQLEEKLGDSHSLSGKIAILEQNLNKQEKELKKLAQKLTKNRKSKTTGIEKHVEEQLANLGMAHSRVKFDVTESDSYATNGMDQLQLLLSSDKGTTYNEIKKAASGGELARINLSIKGLLAEHIQMPSSIYDEIDTGVSGEVARKVGLLMHAMSTNQQVIVITHLPQIASLGEHHLFVYKSENKNTIETRVRALNELERIDEIAKMISGDNLTEHAREQSKELLKY